MTQEEKYKEALLEARAVLEPCLKYSNGKVREALDSIDKELKSFESEDERIRKELIEAFEAYDIESKWNGIPIRSIFAWLEKQKEQKPVSISCGHENDAEWGQEDKEKIVTISEIIEHCTTIPYSGGTLTLNKEYKKELLCFIRTLRPSWKPSEEQIHAIIEALKYLPNNKDEWMVLNTLVDVFKKLI